MSAIARAEAKLSNAHFQPKYRPDVDGLRAVAVLSVVIFHAFPSVIPGGFTGVDIFFVISGFVISLTLFPSILRDAFSFTDFYQRRITRLFPALIAVLLACYVFGWFALLTSEYEELGKHIGAGVFFLSNIVYLNEVGYFDTISELKPLLHLWSLGVEEQFYLIWPVALILLMKLRRMVLPVIGVVAVLSFLFNIITIGQSPETAFYSPFSRFWELMIGALLAYASIHGLGKFLHPFATLQSVAGLALIGCGFFFVTQDSQFPGWWALLPTCGAGLIISARETASLNRIILSNPFMVWVGKISYPLYLWHWPLMSFSRILEQGPVDYKVRIGTVLLSFLLAWTTYSIIEKPIRFGDRRPIKALCAATVLLVIGVIGLTTFHLDGIDGRLTVASSGGGQEQRRQMLSTYSSPCPFSFRQYQECYFFPSDRPVDALLIGDSHAGHYIFGLAEHLSDSFKAGALILNGTCPPLYGIERLRNGVPLQNFGKTGATCEQINNARLDYALQSSAQTIILSMAAIEYNTNLPDKDGQLRYSFDGKPLGKHDAFRPALLRTVERFVNAGKRIIFIKDNPTYSQHRIEDCLHPSRPLYLPWSNRLSVCSSPIEKVRKQQDRVSAAYEEMKLTYPYSVETFDPLTVLCEKGKCPVSMNGQVLYRDTNHLSVAGSKKVMREFFNSSRFLKRLQE